MNNDIKDFFNKYSPFWDNSKDNFETINYLLDRVDIKKNTNVLDLGCGKGVITPLLYQKTNKKVIAMDIADLMIEGAKEIHNDSDKYDFICADFYDYKFKQKFDYIILYNAYPHFLDVLSFCNKAYQILNPNGKLVIMHSLGRSQLQNHHKNVSTISRNILKPEEEYIQYQMHFDLIDSLDLEDRYLMVLKRK